MHHWASNVPEPFEENERCALAYERKYGVAPILDKDIHRSQLTVYDDNREKVICFKNLEGHWILIFFEALKLGKLSIMVKEEPPSVLFMKALIFKFSKEIDVDMPEINDCKIWFLEIWNYWIFILYYSLGLKLAYVGI